jgi:hypothetical protein
MGGEEGQPLLVLEQTRSGLSLYWELPRAALLRCSVDEADGKAALRLVAFSPQGPAPGRLDKTFFLEATTVVRDEPDFQAGRLSLSEFAAPLAVRVALGWQSDDGFLPLTVGRPLGDLASDPANVAAVGRATPQL